MKLFNLSKFKITHRGLYWGLILTFAILYLCVGFVSTLHSITFFGLANSIGLAILLGLTYEVGQASVLFSILMTRNKDKFLPWALMFLLTALQVTANVYASFKFMANSGSTDYVYWQKSILFGVQASSPEMYQVIISWIAGALLPIVALGMTALVAQNIKLMTEEDEEKPKDVVEEFLDHEFKTPEKLSEKKNIPDIPSRESQLEILKEKVLENIVGKASDLESHPIIGEGGIQVIKEPLQIDLKTQAQANKEFEDSLVKYPTESSLIEKEYVDGKLLILRTKFDEFVENEVQKRLREKEDQEKIQEKEQSDDLDKDVESLIPTINLPTVSPDIIIEKEEPEILIEEETLKEAEKATIEEVKKTEIPEVTLNIQTKTTKAGLFKMDSKGELKKVPLTKNRGWHLKKEYIDSNGDIYHFGKFISQEKIDNPEESKKA